MTIKTEPTRIVCFGGGSGLSELLRGLKEMQAYYITAIVTMFDDGGRSGALRSHDPLALPVGDMRRCVEALSMRDPREIAILSEELKGLPGNPTLFHLAWYGIEKYVRKCDYEKVYQTLGQIYCTVGHVIPVTTNPSELCAQFANDLEFRGEAFIDEYVKIGYAIRDIWLRTKVPASPSALTAIEEADFLCFGPGSLYTSVVATLLPVGIKEAITHSKAQIIYVANLMTEGAGMKGMTVDSTVRIFEKYAGRRADHIIVNIEVPSGEVLSRYDKEEQKEFLAIGPELEGDPRCRFERLWYRSGGRRKNDLISIRHNAKKLGWVIKKVTHP